MYNINNSRLNKVDGIKNILVAMIVIGSLWGLLDAITVIYISPMFHIRKLCLCPITVVIYGFTLMSFALVKYRRPLMLIGIGLIAALFKLLDFAILTLPVINGQTIYQPVVNPALASITVSIVFAVIAGTLVNKLEKNIFMRIITGTVAGFLSVVAFVYSAFYITQTPPLIVKTPFQLIYSFHVIVTAIFGAIFLPFGFWLESRWYGKIIILQTKKMSLYYVGSGVIVMFCILAYTIILFMR